MALLQYLSAILSPSMILLVIVLVLAPYVISAARQRWIIYKTMQQLPCDPDQHWLFGHGPKVSNRIFSVINNHTCLQILSNISATMEWYLELSMKYQCKLVLTKLGGMFATVDLTHPDTARVGLGSGKLFGAL